jgi:hypothetical protein
MGKRTGLAAAAVAFVVSALLATGGAEARVEGRSDYSKPQTYSGALRYLRVDLGYEVVERDPEAAYLIFKYLPVGRRDDPSTGTIEIIESRGDVHLFVQLAKMPEYHERLLRDGLLKKLREEYGAPLPKKPPSRAPKRPSDAGAD